MSIEHHLFKLRDQIREEFCAGVDVHETADGVWTVSTPFIYGDGDGLPVVIEQTAGGWRLSDCGEALARWSLDYPEHEVTDSRLDKVRRVVESFGAKFSENIITLDLPRARVPDGFDVAYFLRIVASVDVIPRTSRGSNEQFRTVVARTLTARMPADLIQQKYFSAKDIQHLWPVDWRIEGNTSALLTWTATGASGLANVTSFIQRHHELETTGEPVVILRRSNTGSGKDLARLQDIVPAENLIQVESGEEHTLLAGLKRLGAPVAA